MLMRPRMAGRISVIVSPLRCQEGSFSEIRRLNITAGGQRRGSPDHCFAFSPSPLALHRIKAKPLLRFGASSYWRP